MSAGYAERLSEYPNKGECGLPENFDTQRAFKCKIDSLARMLQQSTYTVVLTGAGISTSAGIPDFRGPNGIWTKEMQERKRRKKLAKHGASKTETMGNDIAEIFPVDGKRKGVDNDKPKFNSFANAVPTYTHRALTHLILHPPPLNPLSSSGSESDGKKEGRRYLHHIVTQNVDGLHRKTNLPRNNMSILHGDIFTEKCDTCHTEHIDKEEIQSIGLKHTGRCCTLGGTPPGSCTGKLKDTLLDWEDDLPEVDWERAQAECIKADLVLCLGTSLRIEPAGGLCEYPKKYGNGKPETGKSYKKRRKALTSEKLGYAIVNLQQTPYDDGAALVVKGRVDDVMKGVMEKLGYADWDRNHSETCGN